MGLAPNVQIMFKLNGEEKVLDYRRVPFSAWQELKAQLGFTPTTLLDAAKSYDLEAFAAIIWLERRQADRALKWPTVRQELEREEIDFEPLDMAINGTSATGKLEEDPTPAGS